MVGESRAKVPASPSPHLLRREAELDQLLGLAQQLSQKKPSNFSVLDRQSKEQIVATILEFDLPDVDRVTFLA
jgi:hypothetical protein